MKTIPILLCLAALFQCTSAEEEAASKPDMPPIPLSPKTRLSSDVEAVNLQWAQRAFVVPFKARLKGEPWNADALAFVEHALVWWADLNVESRPIGNLRSEGKKVIDAGCKDPLVVYLYTATLSVSNGNLHAAMKLEDALKFAEADKNCPRVLAHFMARDVGIRCGVPRKDLAIKCAKWITEEWKDGSYQLGEESLFVYHEMGRWGHFFSEEPGKIKAAYVEIPLPEWARLTLLAKLSSERPFLWSKRNPGKQPPPEMLKIEEEAYDVFAKAWKLKPEEPWAAAEAVLFNHSVEKAKQEPSQNEWFNRAVTAHFDLDKAYSNMFTAVAQRGDNSSILAFGRACLETRRFDTRVPTYLHNACYYIGTHLNSPRPFFENSDVSRLLVVLCLSELRENSQKDRHDWWRSWLTVYAWLGGEMAQAERALADMKGGLRPEARTFLARMQLDEATLRGEVAIAKFGESDRLAIVRRKVDAGERDTAITAIGVLRKVAGPEAEGMLDGLQQKVEFEEEFAKGGWGKLKIPDHLKGWTVVSGKWDAKDGEIQLKGNDAEAVLLMPGRVGNRFEIRGDMEIDVGANGSRWFGIACAYLRHQFCIALSTDQFGNAEQKARVWGAIMSKIPDAPEPTTSLKPKNKFYCRVERQLLTFEINGIKHFDEYKFEYCDFPSNGRFGFVIMWAARGNSWRIKNIEVRKVPEQ